MSALLQNRANDQQNSTCECEGCLQPPHPRTNAIDAIGKGPRRFLTVIVFELYCPAVVVGLRIFNSASEELGEGHRSKGVQTQRYDNQQHGPLGPAISQDSAGRA